MLKQGNRKYGAAILAAAIGFAVCVAGLPDPAGIGFVSRAQGRAGALPSVWEETAEVDGSAALEDTVREPDNLYAQSAVLMDADSGRILFEKNGQEARAMASTTKIMTCILALESAGLDDVVTASQNAASQPQVRLGVSEGRQFVLRDLLYSLMLESHNDAAVMIAEHIGGSTEGFADMMNAKAAQIGCTDTYFITPNGLDAQDGNGFHHTTAGDLAKIMKYCIKDSPKQGEFLAVTRTDSYEFSDCSGSVSYSCINHNAFLHMMEGALSGKTGFTNEAGYCYVGALERDGKTLIVALLACGWPNHKGYKWSDTRTLMSYGLEQFDYVNVWEEPVLQPVLVQGGIPDCGRLNGPSTARVEAGGEDTELALLLRHDQKVEVRASAAEELQAPVGKGEDAGKIQYLLDGEVIREYPVYTAEAVGERTFFWCMKKVFCML